MKKHKKFDFFNSDYNVMCIVVNFITLIRFPLTILFVFFARRYILEIENIFGVYAIVISILVFFSDFIDGKLARWNNCVTKIGQSLDIYLDFIYILSGMIIFNCYSLLPISFTILVIYKFCEFLILSKVLPRGNKGIKDDKYFFDKMGGLISVIYYIIPTIKLIFMMINNNFFDIIMTAILVVTSILTFVASFCKIKANLKKMKGIC